MKIGVIEIMPKGHYTLVESVAKIFASNPNNKVVVYTTTIGYSNISFITAEYTNIEIVDVEKTQGIHNFLRDINNLGLNKAYLITLDHYIPEISKIKFTFPLHLFIHNIYLWFDISFVSNFKRTLKEIIDKPLLSHYWIKRNFIQSSIKKKITKNVLSSTGKFVVLNSNLTNELKKFTKENNIEEIPFSIYQPSLKDKSNVNKFRICVPGMLSASRRDYFSLFEMMRNNPIVFKEKATIDLLGGINISEQGLEILKEAQNLKNEGYKILYYNKDLVAIDEFDEELSKADIVLGNMHVIMNEFNIYGKSKDSGIMYTMIKAAKPGLLPAGYNILPELTDSTLIFKSYQELSEVIINLIDYKDSLDLLKINAKKNSEYFSPELVYKRITN